MKLLVVARWIVPIEFAISVLKLFTIRLTFEVDSKFKLELFTLFPRIVFCKQ